MTQRAMEDLRGWLGSTVFGATFVKKNGDIRDGRYRLGVGKEQTGEGLGYDSNEAGNLIVWDMEAEGYRTIALNRLRQLRAHGETIDFNEGDG